jgi:hypothetical protein
MEMLETITQKVQKIVRDYLALKKENQQLQSEVDLLRNELKKQRPLSFANEKNSKDRDRLKLKLEKINKKIEKLLAASTPATAFTPEETSEKYN